MARQNYLIDAHCRLTYPIWQKFFRASAPVLSISFPNSPGAFNRQFGPWKRFWSPMDSGATFRSLPRLSPLPKREAASQLALQNRNEKLIEAMRDYLRCHYREPVGLHDLAASMHRNVCYLSTLFHQTEGVTIHHYLEELRLASAREMLRDPRCRVGEVAQAAGYSSPDAFRHAFKAREGISPAAWRARQP